MNRVGSMEDCHNKILKVQDEDLTPRVDLQTKAELRYNFY